MRIPRLENAANDGRFLRIRPVPDCPEELLGSLRKTSGHDRQAQAIVVRRIVGRDITWNAGLLQAPACRTFQVNKLRLQSQSSFLGNMPSIVPRISTDVAGLGSAVPFAWSTHNELHSRWSVLAKTRVDMPTPPAASLPPALCGDTARGSVRGL